jgi:hypothetical protein|tara:strand:+ start:3733 stop:3900 length:168 start_codon:yes stop_codon:yes gene_type:complete
MAGTKIYKTAAAASNALKKMGGYEKTGSMVLDLGKGKGYKIVQISLGRGGLIKIK